MPHRIIKHTKQTLTLTKQLGLKDPFETLNYLGSVGEHPEHYGVAGGFGAKLDSN